MIKEQTINELKKEFRQGHFKPSQLKKSKSLDNLVTQAPKPTLTKSKSAEELETPVNSQQIIEQLENKISILELKLETNQRELSELNSLTAENSHLKAQAKLKQKNLESLRKTLAEKTTQLAQAQTELDNSLIARHQSLKDWKQEHQKRQTAENELDNTVEESTEELLTQDQIIMNLKTQIIRLKQTNQNLQKDLNLTQKLAELRKEPYFEPEFNPSLNYFKYALYALLTVWFCLMLRRKSKEFTPSFPERRKHA